MTVPSLYEAACAERRRREQVHHRRAAEEWSPEKRGEIEARAAVDLALWDAIIDYVAPESRWPESIAACAINARKLVDHLRTRTPWDAPAEQQDAFVGLWRLQRHLVLAATLAGHATPPPNSIPHTERKAA